MSDWRIHFEDATRTVLKPGQALFRGGDVVSMAYLVVEGAVSLERVLPNGDRLVLNVAREGELLAEASLFAKAYHCDALVQGAGVVAVLPRAKLLKRLEATPQTMFTLLGDTSREIQRLRGQMEILRIKRVSDRLDAWLGLNKPPPRGDWVKVAEAIGVSPAALYRELAKRRKP